MAKECSKDGCNNLVFSHGYCKTHGYSRTDDKYKRPRMKKNRYIKVSNKPTGELAMFLEIYEENKDKWVSAISGTPLVHRSGFMFINQFAHLLAKGRFKEYRLNKENIWCITPEEHMLLDQGTLEQRERYAIDSGDVNLWLPLFIKVEELKEEYYAEFGR